METNGTNETKTTSKQKNKTTKTTKKTDSKPTKKKIALKRKKVEKPNYLTSYEIDTYLQNMERVVNIWNNTSVNNVIPLEIKNFIYKQLKDTINGVLIDPSTPTMMTYESDRED